MQLSLCLQIITHGLKVCSKEMCRLNPSFWHLSNQRRWNLIDCAIRGAHERMSCRLKVICLTLKKHCCQEIRCCGTAADGVYPDLSCSWQIHQAFIISLWRERLGVSKKSGVHVRKLDFAVMVHNNVLQITVSFKWQRFVVPPLPPPNCNDILQHFLWDMNLTSSGFIQNTMNVWTVWEEEEEETMERLYLNAAMFTGHMWIKK